MATKDATKSKNLTRAQKVELHKKNTEQRVADGRELKMAYEKEADSVVLTDILTKAHNFVKYFEKIAKDGMGGRVVGKRDDGSDLVEDYYLTPAQRLSNLDKASGIESLIAYIEGKIKIQVIDPEVLAAAKLAGIDPVTAEDVHEDEEETKAE